MLGPGGLHWLVQINNIILCCGAVCQIGKIEIGFLKKNFKIQIMFNISDHDDA